MRSRLRVLSGHDPGEFSRLLERAEWLAAELSAGKIPDAIGKTARLDTVLRTRLAAVNVAPATSEPPRTDPETARYLNAAETARYLAVSRSTVVRLTKAGALPYLRPSEGAIRYDRQDLDAFMLRRKES